MKKFLLTLVLLVGMVFGLMAQKLTYQAVVRDNNQQLVVNTDVKATVTITFSTGNPYTTEVNGSTNIHGLLSIEFGDATLNGRDWTGATIAVKVVNKNDESTVYVNGDARPVSAVPYALSVDGQSIRNYLTEHHYVDLDKLNDTLGAYPTTAVMDARHYLTSDSAVIKTMQGNITTNANSIANLTLHTAKNAIRDSVAGQIHDSIAPVADKAHTHDNKALLDNYTQTEANLADAVAKRHEHANAAVLAATEAPYTKADSLKLKGIADSAEVNVQSDWNQTTTTADDYIKNKPTIPTTVAELSDAGNYVKNADLTNLLNAMNAKIDSLARLVDSLSKLPHGGGDTPTEVADGQPCPGAPTVSDGTNTYNTVKIGNQCWMKENLRTNVDGSVYPKKDNQTVTGEDTVTYGRLYTWNAMMKGAPSTNYPGGTTDADTIVQGICPAGWHVPSDAEWDTLTAYVNSVKDYRCDENDNYIAKALSQPTGWSNTGTGCNAGNTGDKSNATGFSAVPAGHCFNDKFYAFGSGASFWSATQGGGNKAWYRYLRSNGSYVNRSNVNKDYGFSVRCLRDPEAGGGETVAVTFQPNGAMGTMESQTVISGVSTPLNANVFNRTTAPETDRNWEFIGWNTKADGTGDSYADKAEVTFDSDTTLYAQWRTWCTVASVNSNSEIGTTNRIDTLKDGDNNKYAVVQIGNQCWMKENMKTTKYANDEAIAADKMFNPGNSADNVAIYGKLYNWSAATRNSSTTYPEAGQMKVQGICPAGWHVPSDAEWDTLTTYVKLQPEYVCDGCSGTDNEEYTCCIAKALSQPTGWSDTGTGCKAGNTGDKANLTGFSAVPAGYCFDGSFRGFGSDASFWSATQDDGYYAWCRYLLSGGSGVSRGGEDKANGFSVRCLRDYVQYN